MSGFEDFKSKTKVEPNIHGDFDCQWCGENVFGAYYDPQIKVMKWWCSQGHESTIDKITL